MASVPIFNTGANTGIYLDNSQVNRSAEKLTSDIIGMEKLKTNKAIQDNERFLEMMAVDPVALMTQRGIEIQSEQMTQFNDKWAAEMQRYKGNLPQDKWIEMRKDRVALESQQGRLAAAQQRYLQDVKLFTSNPRKYREDVFLGAAKNFYETGEYATGLADAPIDVMTTWNKVLRQYNLNQKESFQKSSGGKDVYTRGNKADVEKMALEFALTTPGALEPIIDMFIKQAPPEVFNEADKDKSGTLTEDEINLYEGMTDQYGEIASNPIMKWWVKSRGNEYQDTFNKRTPTSGSGGFGMFFGQQLKSPGVKGTTQTYGDRTYNDLYDFEGSLILKNVPTEGGIKLKSQSSGPITSKGNIEGYLKHYDAERDVLIVAATGTDPNVDSGTLLEIPAGNINQAELNNLPIRIDGKMTTVGQIRGNRPAGTAARKKTFNAVTGKFE